ncbi:MAG TPA: hypothetical protein VEX65_10850, partial [Flavisolibacter sp.]|nr:hypothetical protein [Flavisolibacter sp.]
MEDKSSEVIYRREKRSGGIRSVILAIVFLALINAQELQKSGAAYIKQIPVLREYRCLSPSLRFNEMLYKIFNQLRLTGSFLKSK